MPCTWWVYASLVYIHPTTPWVYHRTTLYPVPAAEYTPLHRVARERALGSKKRIVRVLRRIEASLSPKV